MISAAVEASPLPVIIIGHSKGGLDTLEALITNRALLKKVRGVVTIQTPFSGTPVADYMSSQNVLRKVAIKLLYKLGGTEEVMKQLGTAERKSYLLARRGEIAEIIAAVPVISLGTWKDKSVNGDTRLKLLRDAMLRRGLRNDGLVPLDSALLPGADHIKLGGLSHTVTVTPSKRIPFDRIKFTKALLLMILNRQAPGGSPG